MDVEFKVSNTGNAALTGVAVSDDVITDSGAIDCPGSMLAVGESMTCTATVPAPAPGRQHVDTATVTATPDAVGGPVLADVTDTDKAYAHVARPAAPPTSAPPSPSAPPANSSTTPSPTPGPDSSATPSPTPGPDSGGTGLADTGTQIMQVVAVAVVVLLAGIGLLIASATRRRRHQ
jgi:hypothetical protein